MDRTYPHAGGIYDSGGAMPSEMLVSKFEETNTGAGDDEEHYDTYVRDEITDWTADKSVFEGDETRRPQNCGVLNVRYNGHRGEADDPNHSEMYLGWMGGEDRDPRGYRDKPDMGKMRGQHEARMRFQNFDPDSDYSITGGGRSEVNMMQLRQKMNAIVRKKLRIFSTSMSGRVCGKEMVKKSRSDVLYKQLSGTRIAPETETTRVNNNVSFGPLTRDTALYRNGSIELRGAIDYAIETRAAGKRVNSAVAAQLAAAGIDLTGDSRLAQDPAKAAKRLMEAHVKNKIEAGGFGVAKETDAARKMAIMSDLAAITRDIATDARLGDARVAAFAGKRADQTLVAADVDTDGRFTQSTETDARTRAVERVIAAVARKGIKMDGQLHTSLNSAVAKLGAQRAKSLNLNPGEVRLRDTTSETVDYKHAIKSLVSAQGARGENFASKMHDTPGRKTANRQQLENRNNVDKPGNFGQNYTSERHIGRIAKKQVVREDMRESSHSRD